MEDPQGFCGGSADMCRCLPTLTEKLFANLLRKKNTDKLKRTESYSLRTRGRPTVAQGKLMTHDSKLRVHVDQRITD